MEDIVKNEVKYAKKQKTESINKKRIINLSVFLLIFFISMDGLVVGTISVNKIVCFLFLLFLIAYSLFNGTKIKFGYSPIAVFYIFSAISCIVALIYPFNNSEVIFVSLKNFVQQILFLYLPIIVLLMSNRKVNWCKIFFDNLIIVIKIHAIYGLIQYLLYVLFEIDINYLIFNRLLRQPISWSCLYNTTQTIVLRITSLNHESAIFCLLMSIGFISYKKLIWRIIFFIASVLSYSRTGFLMIVIPFLICFLIDVSKGKKYQWSTIICWLLFLCVAVVMMIIIDPVREFVLRFLNRFNFSSSSSLYDGTSRHLMYYPASFALLFKVANPIQFLLGFGPRVCGVVLDVFNYVVPYVDLGVTPAVEVAWAPECDFVALLMGHGVIGLISYYYMFFWAKRHKIAYGKVLLVIFVGGFTYYLYAATLVNLCFIFIFCKYIGKRRKA